MSRPAVVFVLGGPGAGKGTQCAKIVQDFGFVHLSAGDLLRAERTQGGELGSLISDFIKEGKIIPVEITIRLIKAAMDAHVKEHRTKFLIDGFPRNQDNLTGWNRMMDAYCDVHFVLYLDCPAQVMEQRLLGRNEGRTDDNIESIRKRFSTYQESTLPIIELFEKKGKVRKIDASPAPAAVYEVVSKLFAPWRPGHHQDHEVADDTVDQVKRNFNITLSAAVAAAGTGDAEAGQASKPAKAKVQFWDVPPAKQKEIVLAAVKKVVFNPTTDQDDVLDVQWRESGASLFSISGGFHIYATELKSTGDKIEHHCYVNGYGVLENYQTPFQPPASKTTADEGGCVVC